MSYRSLNRRIARFRARLLLIVLVLRQGPRHPCLYRGTDTEIWSLALSSEPLGLTARPAWVVRAGLRQAHYLRPSLAHRRATLGDLLNRSERSVKL
ncbi:hypothetical protein GCM10027569_09480 [Flindersiella endophytica]